MKVWQGLILVTITFLLLTGCASSGYRMIGHHEILSVQTKTGREVQIQNVQFIAYREVIERSPNVKSVTRMTDLKGKREPSFFDVSSKEDVLVFQAMEKGSNSKPLNLWRISTKGGAGMTRLTAGNYMDMEPAFSADGKSICFSSNRSSKLPKLWRVRASGAGGITRLTHANSQDRWPCYTPNTDKIYFTSMPINAMEWQLWCMEPDGTLPTQLKEGIWPRISPDGKKIVYCAKDEINQHLKIWVMDVDGTNQTQLTSDNESDDIHPNWSHDGKRIVFASTMGKDSNGKRNNDIWVMNADGSGVTQLTTNGSTDFMPVYGPDRKYIYFLSNRGFFWDIWRMEIIDDAQ